MFVNTTSAHGTAHQSKAEAQAAERWLPLGIVAHDEDLPVTPKDAEGVPFTGRADFKEDAFAFLIECKVKHLNSKKNKANAEKGIARLEDQIRQGWIVRGSDKDRSERLKNGWNHSAAQIAAKQEACFDAGQGYLVVFTEKPDSDTLKRLDKYGILWLQEGTQEFQQFNTWRKLARIPGITVDAFRIKDCLITFGSYTPPERISPALH